MSILEKQTVLNEELAKKLEKYGVKNLWLTSYGNSISSGYSLTRTVKPLLLRNVSISSIMGNHDINYQNHAFTRCTNNSEEHIYEWLITNAKESEINKYSHVYYGDGPTNMPVAYMDYDHFDEYYPIDIKNDIGLADLVKTGNSDLANIIIYNGCTGSLLDANLHNGKLTRRLFYGVNRDLTGLEAVLKYIQTINRMNNTHTQVYVCGVPNFLGLNISELINVKFKRVVKDYANTTYVEPIKSKYFYQNLKNGKTELDIHYNEDEYDMLNNNIIEAITNNYQLNNALIDSDREFYKFGNDIEFIEPELKGNKSVIIDKIESIINGVESSFIDNESKLHYYKRLYKYLIDRCPYDWYLLEQKNIKEVMDSKVKTK